jgi:hypothetical protein
LQVVRAYFGLVCRSSRYNRSWLQLQEKILLAGRNIDDQTRLFRWVKDNVDFPARAIRVD